MTRIHLDPPLIPRNHDVLQTIGIDRISGKNQDPKCLDDQQALLDRWVKDRFDGQVEWTFIRGQGEGERLDRRQVAEAEALVAAGRVDLVIMEDLGRHMRRMQSYLFCEACEDAETRLVAINDNIDTAKEWRLNALFACMKHEQSNKDTAERIKRTLRNRFSQGGVVQCPIFGYVKEKGAKSDQELLKDPAAEPIYKEWFRRLDEGATYSEVSDWLNELNVLPGPYSRSTQWTGPTVGRITHNPILKGVRVRNHMKSKRVNKTGRYHSVKADPEERLERYCPHLAFFETDYYDRVVAKVDGGTPSIAGKGGTASILAATCPRNERIIPGNASIAGSAGGCSSSAAMAKRST